MREKDDEPCALIFSRTTEYHKEKIAAERSMRLTHP